eukprot:Seg166.3 transcript_id=Seg166.3/GoldUCD/mRNA.D3Y31 product="putative tyrosinase-like protein tyr-3" protein_id=Seg166.3/GoldUCD/D3Y31
METLHILILLVGSIWIEDSGGAAVKKGQPVFDFYTVDVSKIPQLAQMPQRASRARPGSASEGHRCNHVSSVPRHLTFITRYNHYRKYTHAYGIPIVSTYVVPDAALKRACYVLRFLLADRRVLRRYLYRHYGRIGIVGAREGVTSIPEHRHLGRWWDTRARGLGGTLHIPISTGAEENLLCYTNDRYRNEDIFLHEFSHGIQEIAIAGGGIPGYMRRLKYAYNSARRRGLWRSTYAMSTVQEYFGEGTQSFFDVNAHSPTANGVHGPISTRAKLRSYDPTLFRLLKEVYPCMNTYHKRCNKGTPRAFRMNCDGDGPVVPVKPVVTAKPNPGPTTDDKFSMRPPPPPTESTVVCKDKSIYCASWARRGECSRNSGWMHQNCKKSCNKCGNGGGCTNDNNSCASWAARGECSRNPGYMHVYCKKSCNKC